MNKLTVNFGCPAKVTPCGILLLLCFICLPAPVARAVGFRLPNQDPVAIARGNAFVATADDPAAIYYNPAGITQIPGQQIDMGLYLLSSDVTFHSPTGSGHAETDTTPTPVPQLYYVISPTNMPLSFGLGLYAPYGLKLDWGDNTPFNTLAEYGQLIYLCINPVVAWKVSDSFSIGIGPTINYAEATFHRAIGLSPGDQFRFDGSDTAFGFNAGARWQPVDQWAFGVNYRYSTTENFKGSSHIKPYAPRTDTSLSIEFPQFVVAGVSYRPTPKWNLEVDVDWTDWDSVNSSTFHGTAVGDIVNVFNYESSFMYEFGATRQLPKGYAVSAGFFYSENSIPDKSFNPLIPDSDLYLWSLGLQHKGHRWDWAVAYQIGWNPGRDVSGNMPTPASAIGQTGDGHYEAVNNAVNFSVTLKF